MLIEFSVANFRSIRELQTLTMMAGSSRIARGAHSFKTGLRHAPYILRAAAVFGANGSGKTSLVKALRFTREFILQSARDREPGEPIKVTPFLRSAATAAQPCHFEIVFSISGAIYQLGFTVDERRVRSEWLFVTPRGKQIQRWIEREYIEEEGRYETYVNPSIPGERKTWIASTRDDALLFSTAVQLNGKAFEMAHHWVQRHLRVINSPRTMSPQFTARMMEEGHRDRVMDFLRNLGLDVADVKTEAGEALDENALALFSDELRRDLVKRAKPRRHVLWGHTTDSEELVYFPLEEESEGSRVLFSLAGPWLDVFDNRITVVVDELHNSLHPFALKSLLDRYFSAAAENGGGQLIFTTHDTFAMDEVSLHRDQVWIMDRDRDGSSSLTSLAEYKVRSKEPYRTGYLRGRYGGLPFHPPKIASKATQHKSDTPVADEYFAEIANHNHSDSGVTAD